MGKHLGFYLTLIALALFVPGILMPMFSLNMDVTAGVAGSNLSNELVNKELSLIQTIEELWQDNRLFVAALIFIFSICIPLVKSAMVAIAYFCKSQKTEKRLINFIAAIGKWSMADVFVVAIFLAVLSTNHAETSSSQQIAMFGFKLNLEISSETISMVGQGFYYFTAYCLLSLLATQLYQSNIKSTLELNKSTSEINRAEALSNDDSNIVDSTN